MGKLVRILLTLVVVVVGLVVVLAVVLPFIVDPNDFKQEIAEAVEEKTGRTLTIEGDIGLSVFPWLGLDIGKTSLSNAPGFGDAPMVLMDEVQVRVKLLPLLKKQLEMDTIKLTGLSLQLSRNAQGTTNWADLTGDDKEAGDEVSESGEEIAGHLDDLKIGGVEVTNARVVWDDRSAGTRYSVEDLSFTTGRIAPGKAFDLDLEMHITATEPALSGQLELHGGILIADEIKAINVSNARFTADLKGESFPGGALVAALTSKAISLNLEDDSLSLPEMVLAVFDMEITGSVNGQSISSDKPTFNGAVTVSEFMPREMLATLGIEVPETTDATVLGKADAHLEWQASNKYFSVKTLQLRFDDSRVDGNLRIDNFDKPVTAFNLKLDTIDLDRYLPPPTEAVASDNATASADDTLPVEALRSLNVKGAVSIGSLKAANLRSTDISFKVNGNNGLVRIYPASAKMYDGQYRGDVTLDARRDVLKISMNESLSGVQVGPLLKDLSGDDKLLGRADLSARLTASGKTAAQMKTGLNGNAQFSFIDGAFKGVNIASLIRKAQASLKGQPAPAEDAPNQTDFAELRGTAKITNGVIQNNDLSLKSPLLRITGRGKASLPDETIDYLLTTKFVGSIEGQGGAGLGELKGIAIPVRIGGTFASPSYTPDLAAALSESVKAKVKEKIEEKKEELKEDLKKKLGEKLLKGLFR